MIESQLAAKTALALVSDLCMRDRELVSHHEHLIKLAQLCANGATEPQVKRGRDMAMCDSC